VVEMSGRLRLDMLANLVEAFLKGAEETSPSTVKTTAEEEASPLSTSSSEPQGPPPGPLYFHPPRRHNSDVHAHRSLREEIQSAIPLTVVLASSHSAAMLQDPYLPQIRRMNSMPMASSGVSSALPNINLPMRREVDGASISPFSERPTSTENNNVPTTRERRSLVNRRAAADLDHLCSENEPMLDYVAVPNSEIVFGAGAENRVIPLIPFDELMLIETLGSGRVSTIYRAAWQRPGSAVEVGKPAGVQMVALKVAMVDTTTGDTSHVDELRREADIAARLKHPNICDLVGVAADPECFCLATDFCEGGSLLSLLIDPSRYYEYLPIALDIANGMAYLHSRNVIHRDLKPSNVLLTKDRRCKIADFGMSCANAGQELTAETGTYRYMAPEVIRHESYSSNADVYSFGICLWQLITREIPFATMTPIQAAYAVAEGRRPAIPPSTPRRLQEIVLACWDQDSHKRPSFTYIAMALADYAKMAFSPANVGALTLQIANEMLANVEGNSTVNVDISTPVASARTGSYVDSIFHDSGHSNVGLDIE
jgi:serine/threonine protein kinase